MNKTRCERHANTHTLSDGKNTIAAGQHRSRLMEKSQENNSHTAFASALKRHRCEQPLRMDSPSTGWVTALAGLLAHGS